MSNLSRLGIPSSLSSRCLTLLGTFALMLCFNAMFIAQAQGQDHDRVVRRPAKTSSSKLDGAGTAGQNAASFFADVAQR